MRNGSVSQGAVPSSPDTSYFLDLSRAPYVLYGLKYIDLVSLASKARLSHYEETCNRAFVPRYSLFYSHISVYMTYFCFTCVFFHTYTVKYWKCCSN